MRRQMLWALAVVALMAASFVLFPSRTVRQMNRLVAAQKLYRLDDTETKTLASFLDVLRRTSGIAKPLQINKPYSRAHLNVYITTAQTSSDSPLRVGNSAFVVGSDILVIDSAHFTVGDRKVLATPTDAAHRSIVSAYRATGSSRRGTRARLASSVDSRTPRTKKMRTSSRSRRSRACTSMLTRTPYRS